MLIVKSIGFILEYWNQSLHPPSLRSLKEEMLFRILKIKNKKEIKRKEGKLYMNHDRHSI